MPRTCLACASPKRNLIDKAIAAGAPLREISRKFRISIPSLHRHKSHVKKVITEAIFRREESLGDMLLWELKRLKGKVWLALERAEQEDDRASFGTLARELRFTIGSVFELAERAAEASKPVESSLPDADRYLEAISRALGAGPLEPIGDPSAVPPPADSVNPENLGALPDLPSLPPEPALQPQPPETQIYTHTPAEPVRPAIVGVSRRPLSLFDPNEP